MFRKTVSRILILCILIVFLISPGASIPARAASNLVINGVDIGYAPLDYFSTTGRECACHGRGTCGVASDCTCKRVSGCCQCYGFVLWCENKIYGYNDVSNPGNFTNIGSVSAGSLTASKIKELISAAPIGAHIRTNGSQHSMILISKSDSGFTVAQANGSNNNEYSGYYKCRIGTATYTWSGYVSSTYGSRGIAFIKACKGQPIIVPWTVDSRYPTPFNVYPIATSGKITVYDSSKNAYDVNAHYISPGDLCKVTNVYTNGYCAVSYPTSNGSFSAYAPLSTFIQGGVTPYGYTASETSTSYTRSNMSTTFGSVSKGDQCTVVTATGNLLQLIYPISGGYKCGWIYKTSEPVVTTSDLKVPILGYNASPSARTPVYQYESTLGGTKYGEIFIDDLCTINSVNISSSWANVTYPVSGGTKTGFVYLDQFFPYLNDKGSVYTASVSSNTNVYRKSDMAATIGTVYNTDTIYVVGKSGNKVQIEYPVTEGTNAGKYKLGWITSDALVKNLKSIAVTSNPSKMEYLEGEALNTSGLVITAYYDDGSTANVTGSCSFSGYSNTPGVKTVNVSYSGKSTAFTVNVKQKSPVSLTITAMPARTSYFVGDTFDPSGLKVTAGYDNNTSADVSSEVSIFADEAMLTAGTKTIDVQYAYNEKAVSTSFNITVQAKALQSIAVKTLPGKTTYKKGETLNTSGLTLTASYNNGTSETVTSGFDCSPRQLNTAGTQKITVSYGGLTAEFNVTVEEDLVITSHPQSVEAAAGELVVLSVKASGSNLSYQWQWRKASDTTWNNCSSAGYNTDTLSFTMKNTFDGRKYRCLVSGSGSSALSNAATVTMKAPALSIVSDPADVEAAIGDNVVLKVSVSGTNVSYQWQWSKDGSAWTNCTSSGYNTDTFRFVMKDALNGRRYRCRVSSGTTTLFSGSALITKITNFGITVQPKDTEAATGEKVVLKVTAQGTALNYQWQWSKDGKTWTNCTSSGYNTSTFSFTMKDSLNGRRYRCMVYNENQAALSKAALITLVSKVSITEQPKSTEAAVGETVTLTVKAEGTNLSYQWQWSKDGNTWNNCTSAGCNTNRFSFTMKESLAGRRYRCTVKAGDQTIVSESALISLADGTLRITEQPENHIVASGDTVRLHVGATGRGLSYQWQWKKAGTSWANCTSTGSTTATFSFTMKASMNGRMYRCLVFDEEGNIAISQTALIELLSFASVNEDDSDKEAETIEDTESGAEPGTGEGAEIIEEPETKEESAEEEPAVTDQMTEPQTEENETALSEMSEEDMTDTVEEVNEPVITLQPGIQSRDGNKYILSVEAEGEGLRFKWQFCSEAGSDWNDIGEGLKESVFESADGEDKEKTELVLQEDAGRIRVRCVITDRYGNTVTSEALEIR